MSLISTRVNFGPFPGWCASDNLGFGEGWLAVFRDEHGVIGQGFLEELGVRAQFGQPETFFQCSNFRNYILDKLS